MKLPKKRQSLFFSATLPLSIMDLAHSILNNPARVSIEPKQTTAEKVSQSLFYVAKGDKPKLLNHILEVEDVPAVLVFSRTKHGSDKIVKLLHKFGHKAEAIHGNKSQGARQRALGNFKSGKTRVLVATDIAARGIDIDELSLVVNYDLPNIAETYVHRIGRTGRARASGWAFSFCDVSERPYLKDIEKLIGQKIPVNKEHPFQDKDVEAQMAELAKEKSNKRSSRKKNAGPRPTNKNFRSKNNRSNRSRGRR